MSIKLIAGIGFIIAAIGWMAWTGPSITPLALLPATYSFVPIERISDYILNRGCS